MPNSYVEYTGTGTGANQLGQKTFSYSDIEVLNSNDINAFGETSGGNKVSLTISSRDATAKTITLSTAPSTYAKVRVFRQTSSNALVDFVDGARLTESDLDTAYKQGLFVAQEVSEDAGAVGSTSTTNLSLSGTTTVDNLTATGTLTLPNSSISNDNLAGSIASSKLAGGIDITTQVTGYETGTFTYTTNANLTLNSGTNTGRYTKIGNLVHIQMYVKVDTVTGSNHVFFSGLPFTSASSNPTASLNGIAVGNFHPYNVSFGSSDLISPVIGAGSSTVYLYLQANNAAYAILTNSSLQASSEFGITISYIAA